MRNPAKWIFGVFCCFSTVSCCAQTTIHVNEAEARLRFAGGRASVELPVRSDSSRTRKATVQLELLDTDAKVQSSTAQEVTLRPGVNRVKEEMPAVFVAHRMLTGEDLLLYRLRYGVVTPSAKTNSDETKGTLALSEIMPDAFKLEATSLNYATAGQLYAVRVRAVRPTNGEPVAGVIVKATLDEDEEERRVPVPKPAVTDHEGFARLEWIMPAGNREGAVSVTVTGRIGDYAVTVDSTMEVNSGVRGSLTTDKAIYQPGQTIHARFLGFGAAEKAMAGVRLKVAVRDQDEEVLYRGEMKTSGYGIAAVDWEIPAKQRLGQYSIEVDDEDDTPVAGAIVGISRYDLPTFAVTATPDRNYYLKGQDARMTVSANYLYGEPVRKGHVRVVREDQRTWNFREQKWETKEGKVLEGDTDAQGQFIAVIDLTDDFATLSQNDYQRYDDLRLAVYFSDATTGRTEQKRVDVRLTKEKIHIYVIDPREQYWGYGRGEHGENNDIYISTDYADGRPASCDVEIRWAPSKDNNKPPATQTPVTPQILRRVRTNRYGVAKLRDFQLPKGAGANDADVTFSANDGKGASGAHTETMSNGDDPYVIRLETDKTIYAPGDPITTRIETTAPDATFEVEAIAGESVIATHRVTVTGGAAVVQFLPDHRFEREVSIVAYTRDELPARGDAERDLYASRTVIFPKRDDLKVNVTLSKASYEPGESATADVRVTAADGLAVRGAVGLEVVDKAVEERARTDEDFGPNQWSFFSHFFFHDHDDSLSGYGRDDLEKLDMSKPVPEGLPLVAEILLMQQAPFLEAFETDEDAPDFRKLFAGEIAPELKPVQAALTAQYAQTHEYPTTPEALEKSLAAAGLKLTKFSDPWGTAYQAKFSVQGRSSVLEIVSAGPDKKFGTKDDFSAAEFSYSYFAKAESAMQKATDAYHARTQGYVRDFETLRTEMLPLGFDLNATRDPWGHAYRYTFGVRQSLFSIAVTSAGPDGRFGTADDVEEEPTLIDYFTDDRARIDAAVGTYLRTTGQFPKNEEQYEAALTAARMDAETLVDPWGHPFYAMFTDRAVYADGIRMQTYSEYADKVQSRLSDAPVTQLQSWVFVRSAGPDGVEGTADDFEVASYSHAEAEQSAMNSAPMALQNRPVLNGSSGAISGTVMDPTGAVIAGAQLTAKRGDLEYKGESLADGTYVLRNLPAGLYAVTVESPGFQTYVVTDVPVRSSNVTELDAMLQVGAMAEEVMVAAAVSRVETDSAERSEPARSSVTLRQDVATPRLREYFPETLLWKPEIITDDKGRAQVKFPLADNITTWKLAVEASTMDGQLGRAEKDIRAFQPFFVEHDPPKVLTVGDEIDLPVVLRNYLNRGVDVNVTMKPASWFGATGPTSFKTAVKAGDSANDIFAFRAAEITSAGKQEVSAIGAGASDAISRSVQVVPFGEEKTETQSEVFRDSEALDLAIPDNAIAGATTATLKIYPNLNAHVMESIEAIMRRPYGCAEQTISSGYPSVLYLKYAKGTSAEKSETVARAQKYVQLAYEKLLGYQDASGGFTYWGRGKADLALTAYAVRFLNDAGKFIAVDDGLSQKALKWMLASQTPDGRWIEYGWDGKENTQRTLMLTAYIARTLAQPSVRALAGSDAQEAKSADAALKNATAYLKVHADEIDEPYTIATYAMAAQASGDKAEFAASVARLQKLDHREGDGSYWLLETNTPFYGWGMAGRVETTALVLEALGAAEPTDALREEISRGTLFLLKNEDRYGVWYSTQATVNVLDAIGTLTSQNSGTGGGKASVFVDGAVAGSFDLPAAGVISGPLEMDISKFASAGKHRVEVRQGGGPEASAQVVTDYYVPWTQTAQRADLKHADKTSDALRLGVNFDKVTASVGETVKCDVDVERIGFRGYGMMLAEIGLPPGVDVDRASLDAAMDGSAWEIGSYDILPDRVVLYVWPKAGGTKFLFTFKPRFGMKAESAASVLYDYYNPEARAVVAPVKFEVGASPVAEKGWPAAARAGN